MLPNISKTGFDKKDDSFFGMLYFKSNLWLSRCNVNYHIVIKLVNRLVFAFAQQQNLFLSKFS